MVIKRRDRLSVVDCRRSWEMSSSILDLSVSRGTAADTSSGFGGRSLSRRSPFTPLPDDSVTAELRVSTTDHEHDHATSSDTAVVVDVHAADANDKEVTLSSHTTSGSSNDVTDDARSRDITDRHQLRNRPRDRSQVYPYLDYQAAAAAAARFLVPFPFSSPAAAATGSAPMASSVPPLNFYPLSFPAMRPPPEAGLYLRQEGAAETGGSPGDVTGASRSTAEIGVKVKDDGGVTSPAAAGHVFDPTYAERRRKNNEAARRSRDARRMKERETCLRAALLQQENVRLRAEMAVLKTEIARLHCLLYDKM